jgi:hypothetical protein
MPTKRNSKKKVQLSTDELKPYFSTPLSDCFLIDPCHPSGATHDTDIFGTYTIGPDRSIVFKQCFHSTPLFLSCKTPKDLDDMICKVLIAAAKHSHRYLVINEDHMSSFLSRNENGERYFINPRGSFTKNFRYKSIESLPENIILCVHGEDPENIGRIHYYSDAYSFSLFMPSMISVFEIVPVVFGKPIKLGQV